MEDLLPFALLCFTSFFTLTNPLGTMPVFLTMTNGMNEHERKAIVRRATIVSFITLMVFTFSGQFQAERLIWKANISDYDEDKKRLFQYLAPIAERSWSGNLLAHRLTQDIDQDGLQSAYETFHGDHHQYQSHQTHHHVISSLSQYTYQPGRSLQDQECDKIDQCDYSDQRTL